eukprot:TRINITY_DN14120_c0_g1_i1.p1 TRINITY_DN14120_c0_g1~~TRINITY_DN14120_c0_g1_i1.p1  ORF type:complete len:226 (+),score=63.64 TRINITY_DN14120_c0_g1_i1:102-779(+)
MARKSIVVTGKAKKPKAKDGRKKSGGRALSGKPAAAGAMKERKKKQRESTIVQISDYNRKGWAYRLVFLGKKKKTSSGLYAKDLMKNKRGKIVSKRKHASGKKRWVANGLDSWCASMTEVRKQLGIVGFIAPRKVGGSKEQSDLYKKTVDLWTRKLFGRLSDLRQAAGLSKQPDAQGVPLTPGVAVPNTPPGTSAAGETATGEAAAAAEEKPDVSADSAPAELAT